MKSIAFICPIPEHNGIETVFNHILENEKFKHTFKTSFFLYRKTKNNSFVSRFSKQYNMKISSGDSSLKVIKDLTLFLIRYTGDAIVMLSPAQIIIAKLIKIIFNKKYEIISWMHQSMGDPSLKKKFKLLKYADYNLAISTGIKKELLDIGISNNKIKVIYNPISSKKRLIKSPNDNCKFIYVGRVVLDGQKNLRGLINALKKMDGNWTLDIYGSGKDLNGLEKIIKNNSNLNNHVNLKGWVKNPFDSIEYASALLLNSNYEGLPMTIIEALSYGIPCISTNCPTGPDDVIRKGLNGYLYDIGNYKELLRIINGMISGNITFNHSNVKKSIDFLYDEKYDNRFLNTIINILEKSNV